MHIQHARHHGTPEAKVMPSHTKAIAPGPVPNSRYAMPLMRESRMSMTKPTTSRIPMESTPKEASPVSDVTTDTSRVPMTLA